MSPDVAAHGCQCRGVAVQKCRATPWLLPGCRQAWMGTGCQQDVTGQCHTTAGGAGLALVPEQMAAGEVGLCPNTLHPSLGGSEPQGLARVPTPIPGKVTVPGVSSNPRECPSVPQPSPAGHCSSSCPGWAAPAVRRRDRTVLPMWVQTSPQILHSPTASSQAALAEPGTTPGEGWS